MLAITPRIAWSKGKHQPVKVLYPATKDHLEVHHSVTRAAVGEDALGLVSHIYRWHTVTLHKWSDVFYNCFIDGENRIIEGRNDLFKSQGTATTVCCLGNYEINDVPAVVKNAIVVLNEHLKFTKAIDWHNKRAKGTKFASACPGKNMIDWLETFKEEPLMSMTRANAEWNTDWAYKNILGREPDEGGRAYWVTKLVDGNVTTSQMRWEFQGVRNAAQDDMMRQITAVVAKGVDVSVLDNHYTRFLDDLIALARNA